MILYSNESFIKTIIFQFFKYIFKYGYIPDNFNVSYIIPLIEDKNKSSSDAYEAYPLYLQDTALNTLITFVDSYHQKGTIIELKLDESTTTPVRFAILIQQCNFIDFPSL
jgi:hypothetical protein